MKQNACSFCRDTARDAWEQVTEFLKAPPKYISDFEIRRLQSMVRLAWMTNKSERHSMAGHLLQGLKYPGCAYAMSEVDEYERKNQTTYPRYISQIVRAIRTATKVFTTIGPDDFKRYAPYLDVELIEELFGEDE